MSHIPANPHYNGLMARFDGKSVSTMDVSIMHAQATLALAYEQRTANLIALYAADEACAQGINLATGWDIDNWASLAKTITARLGLDTK